MNKYLYPIFRVFLVSSFLASALGNILNFSGIKTIYLVIRGYPYPELLLGAATVVILLASVSIIIGYKARWSAIVLAIYIAIVSVLYHFDFENPIQALTFFINMSVLGGLSMFALQGPGAYSVDNYLKKKKKKDLGV